MMYDEAFYVEEGRVARQAAAIVMPWLYIERGIGGSFVVDYGCGTGEWLRYAASLDASVIGFDYGVPDRLRIYEYVDIDLTLAVPVVNAELAICLEVAEHLPEEIGPRLVAALAKSDAVLFSAATPGQPGVDHVNCKPHDYWHDLFAAHGMTPTHIGPLFDEPVADFYRRNMFLYERTP